MNRWWGSSDDSQRQASERAGRAARRTIRNLDLNILSDEENFEDAETSFNFANLNLDGQGEDDLETSSTSTPAVEPTQPAANMPATPFDMESKDDDSEAWKKDIKIKFDRHDVKYFFNAIESEMKKYGINSQWSKKNALVSVLPEDIIEECKPILRLTEDEQGDTIYKTLKTEILQLFGPKDEDVFKKAIALRMTGRPSAFGKKLIHILCPGAKPFVGCHCAKITYGFWDAQLTGPIRSKLAGMTFSATTYEEMFKLADQVWLANGGSTSSVPAVVAAAAERSSSSSSPPSTEGAVAAFSQRGGNRGGRGSNRGNRGNASNRGSGRGGQNNRGGSNSNSNSNTSNQSESGQKPHQKGPRASPDVPDSACSQHWKAGRNASYCTDPLNCDWVRIIKPRPSSSST